jgi:tRNA dimethylallyltransferase
VPSPLPILAIVGVTGSGKNELAQEVARRTGASLISVDSRKVYRGMDIGTAKPSAEAIREFDYGMIDCADPREYFSAARFVSEARAIVAKRLEAGSPVIMVGGTGFYLDAFIHGLAELPEITEATRIQFNTDTDERGWEAIAEEARSVDPEFMADIHSGDKTRVRRVIEVWMQSGQRLSDLLSKQTLTPCPWDVRVVWPDVDRQIAIDRIEKRVLKMRAAGLTEEVRGLLNSGIPATAPGLATVGYQEIVSYLEGQIPENNAYERVVINTRRYAKRQSTWFRHRSYVHALETYPVVPEDIIKLWNPVG